MILGLIPARGGSKGIPRKNIKPLGGKPLIQWTVEAARASGVIDRLVVSTDEPEIHRVVESLGVETLVRPEKLATDETPMVDVVRHALNVLGMTEGVLVLLQPTTPFRQPETITRAVEILRTPDVNSVVTVFPVPLRYSPYRALQIIDASGQEQLYPVVGEIPTRRQDLPRAYVSAGSVFAVGVKAFWEWDSLYPALCAPLVVDGDELIDLDEPEDWQEAERRLLVHA